MKATITTLALVLLSVSALGADKKFFDKSHNELTKVEVIRTLVNNPKTEIYQCGQVELTDKATLRNK